LRVLLAQQLSHIKVGGKTGPSYLKGNALNKKILLFSAALNQAAAASTRGTPEVQFVPVTRSEFICVVDAGQVIGVLGMIIVTLLAIVVATLWSRRQQTIIVEEGTAYPHTAQTATPAEAATGAADAGATSSAAAEPTSTRAAHGAAAAGATSSAAAEPKSTRAMHGAAAAASPPAPPTNVPRPRAFPQTSAAEQPPATTSAATSAP
jgi:hypothetical protein